MYNTVICWPARKEECKIVGHCHILEMLVFNSVSHKKFVLSFLTTLCSGLLMGYCLVAHTKMSLNLFFIFYVKCWTTFSVLPTLSERLHICDVSRSFLWIILFVNYN